MQTKGIILALALCASTGLLTAQQEKPQRPNRPRPADREAGQARERAPMSIIEALDINRDGTIDADEIAKASDSLKKLDKNGDGKLSAEEFRPGAAGRGPNAERPGGRERNEAGQGQGQGQGRRKEK